MDRNSEPAGIFNTPQVQYLAPGGGELKHFLAGEDIDLSRRRDNTGVGGVDAVDVRVDFTNAGPQRCGSATAVRSEPPRPRVVTLSRFLRPALESGDDRDFAVGQTGCGPGPA